MLCIGRHIMLNTSVLVRSLKLSNIEPSQYLGTLGAVGFNLFFCKYGFDSSGKGAILPLNKPLNQTTRLTYLRFQKAEHNSHQIKRFNSVIEVTFLLLCCYYRDVLHWRKVHSSLSSTSFIGECPLFHAWSGCLNSQFAAGFC